MPEYRNELITDFDYYIELKDMWKPHTDVWASALGEYRSEVLGDIYAALMHTQTYTKDMWLDTAHRAINIFAKQHNLNADEIKWLENQLLDDEIHRPRRRDN